MKKALASVTVAALLCGTSAYAADQLQNDQLNKQTTGGATNSGPGVQGPPDTRTGPSTKGMENSNSSTAGSSSTGTSSGEAGDTGKQTGPAAGTTSPSQDASGVAGAPGNKNGPSAKEPSNNSSGSSSGSAR